MCFYRKMLKITGTTKNEHLKSFKRGKDTKTMAQIVESGSHYCLATLMEEIIWNL